MEKRFFYGAYRIKDADIGRAITVLKISDCSDCLSPETLAETYGNFTANTPTEFKRRVEDIANDFLRSMLVYQLEIDTVGYYKLEDMVNRLPMSTAAIVF